MDLEALTDLWKCQPNQPVYPSMLTLGRIGLAIGKNTSDSEQAEFLTCAWRHLLKKWSLIAASVILLATTAGFFHLQQNRKLINQKNYEEFLRSDSPDVLSMLEEFKNSLLEVGKLGDQTVLTTVRDKLRHAIAQYVVGGNQTKDAAEILSLIGDNGPEEYVNIVRLLKPKLDRTWVSTSCESLFENAATLDGQLKYAVVAFELGDNSLINRIIESSETDATLQTNLRHRMDEFDTITTAQLVAGFAGPRHCLTKPMPRK